MNLNKEIQKKMELYIKNTEENINQPRILYTERKFLKWRRNKGIPTNI